MLAAFHVSICLPKEVLIFQLLRLPKRNIYVISSDEDEWSLLGLLTPSFTYHARYGFHYLPPR